MLVDSCYYKASYENRKWPWQKGYVSWKIAQQEKGGHSHEELKFKYTVLVKFVELFPNVKECITNHPVLSVAFRLREDVCVSSSSRDGGVRFKLASLVLKNIFKWDILDTTDDMNKAVTMLSFALGEDGKDYDFAGVTGFKLSFIDQNPDKWYCTELCDKAKQLVGLWMTFYRSHPSMSYWIQKFLTSLNIT